MHTWIEIAPHASENENKISPLSIFLPCPHLVYCQSPQKDSTTLHRHLLGDLPQTFILVQGT